MSKLLEERVVSYTDLLTTDLEQITTMVTNLRGLAEAEDANEVHKLLLELQDGPLENDWVQVPRQYSKADIYMIAMDRFLTSAGLDEYEIRTPADREEVTLIPTGIDQPAAFQFRSVEGDPAGELLVEVNSDLALLYWSPLRRELLFNADALTELLVNRYRKKTTAKKIRTITYLLTQFAYYLEREFAYKVDYNVLETQDEFLYPLVQTEMPAGMLDRLFILSAESDLFLQNITNGAGMQLHDEIEIRIFFEPDPTAPGGQRWHFQVVDGRDAFSWLDVLLDYDFIAAWYLIERKHIAIKSDGIFFGERPAEEVGEPEIVSADDEAENKTDKVVVQVLQPQG